MAVNRKFSERMSVLFQDAELRLNSPLPNPHDLRGEPAVVKNTAQTLYLDRMMESWQIAGRLGLGSIGGNIGMASSTSLAKVDQLISRQELPDFSDFASTFREIGRDMGNTPGLELSGQVKQVGDIATKILGSGFEVSGWAAAGAVTQAIPIIGWVIGFGIKIGQGVARLVQSGRVAPDLQMPLAFNPQRDQNMYNNFVMSALKRGRKVGVDPDATYDWTQMFLPPGPGWGVGRQSPFARIDEVDGTARFQSRSFRLDDSDNPPVGAGVIPGSCLVHAGIDIRRNEILDLGSFFPLLQRQAMWMWTGYVEPMDRTTAIEPAMFCVNADLLRSWHQYLSSLRKYLDDGYQDSPFDEVGHKNRGECRAVHGKSRCRRRFGKPFSKSDRDRLVDKYARPEWFGWANSEGHFIDSNGKNVGKPNKDDPWGIFESTPYLSAIALRQRQMQAARSLTAAYVDQSFASIAGDPEVRAQWEASRMRILQNSDELCEIDIESVPIALDGGIYRDNLVQRGAGPGCRPAGHFVSRPAADRMANSISVPIDGAGPPTGGSAPLGDGSGRGSPIPALLAAGAAVAAYALL